MSLGLPEPVTAAPVRPVRPAVMAQGWRDVVFLHWPVSPETVTPLLPPGVRPDTLDGLTYVGLIALTMRGTGIPGLPGVPYLGTFPEVNVRLYSVDADGRREPSEFEHFVTARWALHAAWHDGRTFFLPVAHPRWELRRAEVLDLSESLIAASGLPQPEGPPVSALYAPGVPVRAGLPRRPGPAREQPGPAREPPGPAREQPGPAQERRGPGRERRGGWLRR